MNKTQTIKWIQVIATLNCYYVASIAQQSNQRIYVGWELQVVIVFEVFW